MKRPPAAEISEVFAARPAAVRRTLMRLRALILEAASEIGAGEIEEALRWGQPAFLAKGGSTIRIDGTKSGGVALYFICHTDLIARFRELYPKLSYEGNRAILLEARGQFPEDALRHCISLALTYRKRKR